MNIADAVLFIKKHTSDKKNPWSEGELAGLLRKSINERALIYSHDAGQLTGIGFGMKEGHTVFCLGLVIRPDKRKELLPVYVKSFKDRFKGYKLKAKRHGKNKEIDYGSILGKLS